MGDDRDAAIGVASTIHALDETAVALRPAPSAEVSSSPLVRGTCSAVRYEIQGRLGEGGMGMVDSVWDADLMRHLAVKRLHPELRNEAKMVRLFLWEARITAHLDHPNIVPIHDLAVSEQGNLFFTMKRAKGRTLESVIRDLGSGEGPPLLPAARLRLFIQICHAISFAHERGVLHRDLKPANIMLGDHGEVMVMDWGLALPLPNERGDALRSLRLHGDELHGASGTPLYMSPEQAKNSLLDERSDVYTLGVMLYELLALKRPYDASSLPALLAKITAGEAVPLQEVAPSTSRSLLAVVARAMALDPAARYATVSELREDIERVLDGHTPRAEDASMLRRAARVYVSRERGLSRLRPLDIELFISAAVATGVAGTGLVLSPAMWPRLLAVLAALLWIPPSWRWWREHQSTEP